MLYHPEFYDAAFARATYSDEFESTPIAKRRSIATIALNIKIARKVRMALPIHLFVINSRVPKWHKHISPWQAPWVGTRGASGSTVDGDLARPTRESDHPRGSNARCLAVAAQGVE